MCRCRTAVAVQMVVLALAGKVAANDLVLLCTPPPPTSSRRSTSKQNQTVHVYYTSVPLDPSKTVAYVVPPDVTQNGETAQVTALHVFAITVSG
jgi:hypothetical protein